jgi:hypothetical protein
MSHASKKYTIKHCSNLLEANPAGCAKLFTWIRREVMVAERKSNTEYVTQALHGEDGLTSMQITRKCLQAGAETMDRGTAELVLVRLIREGKVEQRGDHYYSTEAPETPAAEPEEKPAGKVQGDAEFVKDGIVMPGRLRAHDVAEAARIREAIAGALDKIDAKCAAMSGGEQVEFPVPEGLTKSDFAQRVRVRLLKYKHVRWSVNQLLTHSILITRRAQEGAPEAAPAPTHPAVLPAVGDFKVEPPISVTGPQPPVATQEAIHLIADLKQKRDDIDRVLRLLGNLYGVTV